MSGCETTERARIDNDTLRVRFMVQHLWHNIINSSLVDYEERVNDLW